MKHVARGRRAGLAHRASGPFGRRASPRPTERSRRSGRRSEGVSDGPRRILLVDDHPIVRQGLAELINRQKNLRICGETGSGQEVPELVRRLKPDLAVIDVSLKDGSGLELLKVLKAEAPHLALLVLSMHEESLYAERSLRAGALGYVMKGEANERILKAIYSALKGEIYLSDSMKERLLHHLVEGATGKKDFSLDRLRDR